MKNLTVSCGPTGGGKAVLAVLALLLPVITAVGEDRAMEGYAVLQRQPEVRRGVPILPANTLRYIHAVYTFEDGEIEVFLVPGEPADHEDQLLWLPEICDAVDLSRSEDNRARRVVREQYRVFISVAGPQEFVRPEICAFAGSFVELFEFFLAETPRRIETLRPPPEMPAIIDMRETAR